jgi:uncharacterized FAD-dependent dehydrogenase
MLRTTELRLDLDHDPADIEAAVRERLGLAPDVTLDVRIVRRGYDARNRRAIKLVYTVDITLPPDLERDLLARRHPAVIPAPDTAYRHHPSPPPGGLPRPVVIGAGPCGLFAALVLAQWGFRPIVIERGQSVRIRTADTWRLWREGTLDPESNVQFGEGGAGTFSDGKLWSGVRDPQRLGRKVLEEMVRAGAPDEILTASKPHIGTFRLVTVVTEMRAQIEALGGEYRFATRVEAIEGSPGGITGLRLSDGATVAATHVILAPGHSARDTFAMLHASGIAMDAKPFSIGVRIEHPQSDIDRARFGSHAGHPALGAADYKLVHHAASGRSVYSFCMCPGGQVVAATSEPGRVATNGMSQYSRAERNANAGLVVGIDPSDYRLDDGSAVPGDPLAGIAYQRHWERLAFVAGGGDYRAPAQRVGDFLAGRPSTELGGVIPSYQPGVTPTDLARCLPGFVIDSLREAIPAFASRIPGFDHPDAVMTGVETRTSSPLRIRRDEEFQSPSMPGLFPAGEGAGYAGGILSAGIDGIRVAEALAASMTSRRQRAA